MKCHYYLAPDLNITRGIQDDLEDVGIDEWCIHVISKDEAGLSKKRIHSGNFVEKSDGFAGGLVGALIGLLVGVLIDLVLMSASESFSAFIYVIIPIALTLLGLWEGMLLRAKYEGKKVQPFHDEIEGGEHLFLIYTPRGKSSIVRRMMREKHPQAKHVAVDTHYMDPLRPPTRRRVPTRGSARQHRADSSAE
jgi:hypothetical protein